VDDPWDRWEEISLLDLPDVPPAHLPLYAIGWLRTEINNGGFDLLFYNSWGEVVPHALAAIRRAGWANLANLIERAMAVVGNPYPDRDQRQTVLIALSDQNDPRLDALDAEYYDLEASVDLDELMRSVTVVA